MRKDGTLQQIKEFIIANRLSMAEEYDLWDMLGNRMDGSKKCLAIVIDREIRGYENEKCSFGKYRSLYLSILKKCFWETETGSMEAAILSPKKIEEFIVEIREQFSLEGIEEYAFMQMLQIGLNKLGDDGNLKFSPDRLIFRKFVASKNSVSFINNPYSEAETEKIMEWSKTHPADVRAQAVSLWFTKGLTLIDIVTLTKKDCWGRHDERIERAGIELFQISIRGEIVRRALDTHPKDVKYVFSVPSSDYSTWEGLTERGLLIKLKAICKKTGIVYKPILINEAIRLE